jgi:hypothetical protein
MNDVLSYDITLYNDCLTHACHKEKSSASFGLHVLSHVYGVPVERNDQTELRSALKDESKLLQ